MTRQWTRRSVLTAAGAAAAVAALPAGTATAGTGTRGRPNFRVPFPCGQQWYVYTHPWGHWLPENQSDWERADGTTEGSVVVASAAGRVVASGFFPVDSQYVGASFLRLAHGGGWSSVYCHMPVESMAPVGRWVRAGARIGVVGDAGLPPWAEAGPHLHYEQHYREELAPLHLFGGRFVPPTKPEQARLVSDNGGCTCRSRGN